MKVALKGSLVSPVDLSRDFPFVSGLYVEVENRKDGPVVLAHGTDKVVGHVVSPEFSNTLEGHPAGLGRVATLVVDGRGPRVKVTFTVDIPDKEGMPDKAAIQEAQVELYNFMKRFRPSDDDDDDDDDDHHFFEGTEELEHLEKVTRLFAFHVQPKFLALPDPASFGIRCSRDCDELKATKAKCIKESWPVSDLCTLLHDDHTTRYGKKICEEHGFRGSHKEATENRRAAFIVGGVITYCYACHTQKTYVNKETTQQTEDKVDADRDRIKDRLTVSGDKGQVVNIRLPNLMYEHSLESFSNYWLEWFPHYFDSYGEWKPHIFGHFGSLLAVPCADQVPFPKLFGKDIAYNEEEWRLGKGDSSGSSRKRDREESDESASQADAQESLTCR